MFAFYCTVTERFLTFDNQTVFESVEEFTDCFNSERKNNNGQSDLDRYLSKIPTTNTE